MGYQGVKENPERVIRTVGYRHNEEGGPGHNIAIEESRLGPGRLRSLLNRHDEPNLYDLLFSKMVLCYRNPIISRDGLGPGGRDAIVVETGIESDTCCPSFFTHDAVGVIMGNAGCVSSESTYGRPFFANMNVSRLH
jgi:hypothetical protein